jgi:hypothetical protein
MYGKNRCDLVLLRCVVCARHVAVRVDPEDTLRHEHGVLIQDAFADESGVPYLDAASRELLISGTCGDCYRKLCPDPITHPTAYN